MKHVLQRSALADIIKQAVAIVACLSKSSSKYLVRAKEAMLRLYGRSWALMSVCDTRWNSIQMCLASLLRVRSALRSFAVDEVILPADLDPLADPNFWSGLATAENILRPVAAMSFVLEKQGTTLAHVMHALGLLYQHLMLVNDESDLPFVMEDVCKRWAAQEQPLYILAYLLHPRFTDTALKVMERMQHSGSYAPYFTIQSLARAASAYFNKWFFDYEASVDEMPMQLLMFNFLSNADFRKKLLPSGCFSLNSQWSCYETWVWALEKRSHRQLALLALKLLGAQPQSADQERVFKEFARHQTASRNRMGLATMTKLTVVKNHLMSNKKDDVHGAVRSKNRIVKADERPRVGADSNLQQGPDDEPEKDDDTNPENDENAAPGIDMDDDNVVDFWNGALSTLESDDEEEDLGNDEWIESVMEEGIVNVEVQPTLNSSVYDNADDFTVCHSERIAAAITSPLPDANEETYPQEVVSKLKNYRAAKFPLIHLFGYPGNLSSHPDDPGYVELFPLVKPDEQ